MSAHAILSPSGADRWMTCPGSPAMERGRPDTSSSYADEGTAAHFVASEALEHGGVPADFIGQHVALPDDGSPCWADTGHLVTQEMADYLEGYVSAVRLQAEGGTLMVERRLDISMLTGEEGAGGTADAVVITRDAELQIHDLKYGMRPVPAENNRQLMIYALGALEEYAGLEDFTGVRLFIHQPRVRSAASEWAVSLEDLAAFRDEVETSARHCHQALGSSGVPLELLVPSEDACRYCKASGDCPVQDAAIAQIVGADFADLSEPPEVPEDGPTLSQKMAATGMVEGWIKAVRAATEAKLLSGEPVPGWKLVQGREGARRWNDPEEGERVLKSMGLKVDEMYDKKVISPTAAEKILGPKGSAPSARRWARVVPLIVRSPGGISVAPESDKRPAYQIATTDDFEPVSDSSDLV